MKTFLALSVLLFPLILYCQQINFTGKIYDGINFFPLEGVNVYNFSSKKYTFSDKEGNFVLQVNLHDTLIFSKGIYRQLVTEISESNLQSKNEEYFLYYKAVVLKEVKVITLNPSYEGFKNDVAAMHLPDIYSKIAGIEISEEEKMGIDYKNSGPNLLRNTAAAHPITYLYETFSRKAKMKQLVDYLVTNQEEVDRIPAKYNRQIVENLTGYKGEELLNFMMYCRFNYYDIIKMSDEEIINQIKRKYTEYEYQRAILEEE